MNIEELAKPLNRDVVKKRQQGGAQVSYIEGWHAIAEANRIFGYDGWARETVELKCVCERERSIGSQGKPGWGVTYTARVRITVTAGERRIVRDGCGAGHGIGVDLGEAHESAIKEAETDAMKRALMTFGNPFGLALYDKQQREVQDAPKPDPAKIAAGLVAEIGACASLEEMKTLFGQTEFKRAFNSLPEDQQKRVLTEKDREKTRIESSQTIHA